MFSPQALRAYVSPRERARATTGVARARVLRPLPNTVANPAACKSGLSCWMNCRP